jgi:N-acetylneuraminic acid mutarotase
LNLANPATGWQNLPAYPGSNNPANVDGAGRQGFLFTTVGERLYAWGGFNYTSPATYADGYKLSRTAGVWAWSPLPDLPTRRSGGGMVTVGTKIYAVGGADYDLTKSYTRTDRTGTIGDYGARIYAMDTASPVPTWQELPTMPGTPRYVHATAAVGDKIYVIGGATGAHPQTHTVVDNWVFDTTTQAWSRIRDLPVASANFPSGRIVVDDRYILLAGGYQYGAIENPDGSTRPVYGTPGKADPSNPFYNDIWVYDTETNLFGTATSMPLDNNLPTTVYFDGKLHMIGGETDGATIFGQEFAHHPDLYLIGTPRLATPGSQWNSSASGN